MWVGKHTTGKRTVTARVSASTAGVESSAWSTREDIEIEAAPLLCL